MQCCQLAGCFQGALDRELLQLAIESDRCVLQPICHHCVTPTGANEYTFTFVLSLISGLVPASGSTSLRRISSHYCYMTEDSCRVQHTRNYRRRNRWRSARGIFSAWAARELISSLLVQGTVGAVERTGCSAMVEVRDQSS